MAEVLVEKQVVMPSFAELERANARVALRRINFALDLVIDRVAVPAADWGNWVDSYRFMQDRNPDFITTGITNVARSEEHTSELQSRLHLVCRLLLEKN